MKREKGFTLIEVLISLAILGVIAVAFLGGLASASKGLVITDERQTARNLAEAQMEYVKNQPYDASYLGSQTILDTYEGYDVVITTTPMEDGNVQKIAIAVSHQGKAVTALTDYKVN